MQIGEHVKKAMLNARKAKKYKPSTPTKKQSKVRFLRKRAKENSDAEIDPAHQSLIGKKSRFRLILSPQLNHPRSHLKIRIEVSGNLLILKLVGMVFDGRKRVTLTK